ncbi:uncharacterized protein RHOBADRAFT_52033 [Rhodotorula graminis WP1]|uniref:Uncharacterized protein n=1 Tax=Rhodotorula graminis (strain WP1) TaxID=578459 RepID=A0A194SCF7_RHOGW|nr:uncharacterized protein RHOBADRAFT_52033 [Rhodotorula graminis WP1]KPV77076.1 hypothetical protein RHOBADRAFT_52033 [Rhodotorula graminis WP1]
MDDLLDLDFASSSSSAPPAPRGRSAFDYLARSTASAQQQQQPARAPAPAPPRAAAQPQPQPARAPAGTGDAFSSLFGTSSHPASATPPLSMQARLEHDSALKIGGLGARAGSGASLGGLGGGAPGGNRSGSTPPLLQPTQQRGASPSPSLLTPTSRTASPLSPSFPPPPHTASRAPAPALAPSVAKGVWDFDLLTSAVPVPVPAKSPSPAPSRAPARPAPAPAADDDDDPLFDLGFGSAPAPTGAARQPAPRDGGGGDDGFDLLDAFAAPARPSPPPTTAAAADAPRRATPSPSAPSPTPSPSPSPTARPPPHLVAHLVEMGFPRRAASAALVASYRTAPASASGQQNGWDLEAALEVLEKEERRTRQRGEAQEREQAKRGEEQRRHRPAATAADAPVAPTSRPRARPPTTTTAAAAAAAADGPPHQQPLDAARVLQDQAGDMLLSAQKLGFSMFKSANALLGEGKKALARRIEEQRAAGAAAGAGAGAGRDGRTGERERGREGAAAQQGAGRPRWWTEEMEREEQEDKRRAARAEGRAPPPPPPSSSFRDDDEEVLPARPFAEGLEAPAPRAPAAAPAAGEYRSPFRRAKAAAPPAVAEADLLSGAPAPAPARSTPSPSLAPTTSRAGAPPARASPSPSPSPSTTASRGPTPTPTPRRTGASAPSSRPHLAISPAALASATSHKARGNSHFKLGRFGDATVAYSRALDALPRGWVGRVPLLNNRAQARLRSGEDKLAVEDCGEAVEVLLGGGGGGGGGAGEPDLAALEADGAELPPEVIELYGGAGAGGGGASVDLKDQLGKALGRRAKALEALEKWSAARDDWERVQRSGDEVVLRGAGGAKMVGDGVARCRKMLNPAPPPSSSAPGPSSTSSSARPAPTRPAAAAAAAASRPKPRPAVQGSGDAVRALQAQQAAAAAEDDERHALKDSVDARVAAWKGGKEANLRALIASLDKVLWPELGWKNVGMHELISEGQLKVRYVRAIAKLHPDKLNVANTTVEQRMVAALVFAALNDAWNGMNVVSDES